MRVPDGSGRPRTEAMADLVDLVTSVAREVRISETDDGAVIRLSSAEVHVMRYVDKHPGQTSGEVAEGAGLQRSNLSAALRNLEVHGLVERRASGRTVHVWPTERAEQNVGLLRHEWATRVEQALDGRTDRVEEAVEVLRALEDGLVRARHGRREV